jgi:cytochrome b561
MIHDSPTRYGIVTRALHWITVILILLQFLRFTGKYIDPSHWINTTLKPLHGSLGFLLLIVVILRIVWLLAQYRYRPIPEQFAQLARGAHLLMYILMVLMPLTGIAYVLGRGGSIAVFGHVIIPAESGHYLLEAVGSYHSKIAWILLILVIGHIGAALHHHFIRRDDTLKRML